jgi:hypothetical protein
MKTNYRTIDINGTKIFYREAGCPTAPTLLLLHGFHRADLSLRDKTESQNESTKICQINSQFCPRHEQIKCGVSR